MWDFGFLEGVDRAYIGPSYTCLYKLRSWKGFGRFARISEGSWSSLTACDAGPDGSNAVTVQGASQGGSLCSCQELLELPPASTV